MSRTLSLEEMPSDTRRVFEELLTSDTPVLLLRNGQALGGMIGYPREDAFPPLNEEEKAALLATVLAEESIRGSFSLEVPSKPLFSCSIDIRPEKLSKWKPKVILDRRSLEYDGESGSDE